MSASPGTDRTTPLLRARIREVFRHLPKALAGEEEPIHQMRVAGRRLRVALPQLARRPGGKRVRRAMLELQRLTRAAGASRDYDVMLGLLEERLQGVRGRTPELRLLLRRLRAARTRSRGRMADALLDLEIARLRRDLRAILARKGDRLFDVMLRLGQTQGAEGGALMATFETLGTRFDPEALHRLRIRARRLRYASELHLELERRRAEGPEILKGLQEQLGVIRDFYLVSAWFAAQSRIAGEQGQAALAAEAHRHEAHFIQQSHAKHRELLDGDPVARLGPPWAPRARPGLRLIDDFSEHVEAFLDLEYEIARTYYTFICDTPAQALTLRAYLFERNLCEYSPPHARLLVEDERLLGMFACLDTTTLTRCRLRAAMALARWEVVAGAPALQRRLQRAARVLVTAQPGDLYLSRIAVAVPARGRGLGRHLLGYVEEEAHRRGCHRIVLEVDPGNTAATSLYPAAAFDVVGEATASDETSGRTLTYRHLAKTLA